jgi:monoamine oxidase
LASAGDWIEPASAKFDESVYAFLSRLGWSDAAIALNYDTNIGRGTSAHDCSVLTWFFRRAWDNLQTEIENVALKVVGGNQALPEAMAAKLGDAVRINAAVAGLRSDGNGIEARCEDGSVHRARFAICATPITPLRWIKFDPLLPPVLAEAIARLPSMRITKVFLNVKRPFWDDDGLSPAMWTDTVAGEVAALRQAADSDRITGLIARVRGYASMYLDTLGERDAGAAVVAAIESLRPAAKGQLEVAGYKSWAVDRFSGGTWAEWEPGQIHRFLPELVKPAGRIHFAGEHASLANRGMEAAMEAGERAALEVMARL